MPTQEQVPEIIQYVQERLEEASQHRGVHLSVEKEDSKLEDDWLYVCVTPTQPGERASDHVDLMSEIELELRKRGTENVLLVPTMAD